MEYDKNNIYIICALNILIYIYIYYIELINSTRNSGVIRFFANSERIKGKKSLDWNTSPRSSPVLPFTHLSNELG